MFGMSDEMGHSIGADWTLKAVQDMPSMLSRHRGSPSLFLFFKV